MVGWDDRYMWLCCCFHSNLSRFFFFSFVSQRYLYKYWFSLCFNGRESKTSCVYCVNGWLRWQVYVVMLLFHSNLSRFFFSAVCHNDTSINIGAVFVSMAERVKLRAFTVNGWLRWQVYVVMLLFPFKLKTILFFSFV